MFDDAREPERGGPRSTDGIVDPTGARAWFTLDRRAPSADVADVVGWYWVSHWNLGDRAHVQPVIAHPVVNVVAEPHGFAAHGFVPTVDERRLTGHGVAVAAMLRPGAFAVLSGGDTLAPAPRASSGARPRTMPASAVLGPSADEAGAAAVEDGLASRVDDAVAHLDALLRLAVAARRAASAARRAWRDLELVTAAVDAARDVVGPGETVDVLARHLAVSVRGLQRAFERAVGVGPKWVLQRQRVHRAAELLAIDPGQDLAALAEHVGYYDQAHFTRDFVTATGTTPGAYARRCAASLALLGPGRVADGGGPVRATAATAARL
ncbi:helix-turn-helix domain-containing protein [Luteimicrobium sp. NPDC057192]|uniref:AraC family transcriptional regulator n=1 Tax=Luteimicrobium sp. NPDC057192 TaxID=3346042 RepID=UPI003641B3EE